ncbi:unnamed protein product [Ilex paraguariensis]|uniref:PI4-kinase N-terminal domain-containing protein n=1 Tax=Ilex paraguariensis TaxID=185542 RepID=A0ABC8TDJ4_9AQUA
MLAFLKIRKRDRTEQGQLLKVGINKKLSVYQAATRLQINSLSSVDLDGKSSKRLLHGTLALLIEAAEACLFSVWRKLRICDELFGLLFVGISQIALTRCRQLLRVLLIRFKPLVLSTCAQKLEADFLGPLFLVVAEICSDFDPIVYVEPALLKLFRNLWFYVALFGFAPPIQKTLSLIKSVSRNLNSVGNFSSSSRWAIHVEYSVAFCCSAYFSRDPTSCKLINKKSSLILFSV